MAESPETGALGGLVSPPLLARFEERIGDELADRPPAADVEELRREAGSLLSRAGIVTHYELLGVSVGASIEEVTARFTALARRVHPSLAPRVNLPEAVLRLLFEHATLAYLVLSDPVRRKEYDGEQSLRPESAQSSPEELAAVRRDMARKSFRRAQALFKAEEYHYVVELMRTTVLWDPRPEGFALLADAQARNPHWRAEALDNLKEAMRLAPADMGYRLRHARLLEEMERVPEAIEAYKAVLEKVPNQPDAVDGLERLGIAPQSSGSKGSGGWFR